MYLIEGNSKNILRVQYSLNENHLYLHQSVIPSDLYLFTVYFYVYQYYIENVQANCEASKLGLEYMELGTNIIKGCKIIL